jgi:hypothetical protein
MSECRRCGNETDRHSVAAHPLCWDCADHGPVNVDELRPGPNEEPSAIERRSETDEC